MARNKDKPLGISRGRHFLNVATKKIDGSTPTATHPEMPSTPKSPVTAKPNSAAIWRMNPDARNPKPSHAIPIPVAGRPNIIRARLRNRSNIGGRRWRRLRSSRDRIRRRFHRDRRWSRNVSSSYWRRGGINRFVLNTSARDHSGQSGQQRNKAKFSFHININSLPPKKFHLK